jgi:hypothetical protein
MDWEGLAMGLAMLGNAEQPCEVCGDIHDSHCEPEDLNGYRDPGSDPRFA